MSLPREIADALASAAITTLQELAQVEAVVESGECERESNSSMILATITMLREPPGQLSLALAEEAALALAARYLPPGTSLGAEIVDDVAGEFVNVIAGQWKTSLKGTPYHFDLSLPTVVHIHDSGQLQEPLESIAVRLSSEVGEIVLQAVCLPA